MIAGPNGAGKSTLFETRLRLGIAAPFINADVIQRDELKDASMQASYKAAEIAESRRRDCLAQGKSFVTESTFSHPSKLELVDAATAAGFRVVVYHLSLRSVELAVHRVAYRFSKGGHDVPQDKIRERFARNPALIREAVLKADKAFIYDNSALARRPTLLLEFTHGSVVGVSDQVTGWAHTLYAKELEPFSATRLNPVTASFAEAKLIAHRLGGAGADVQLARSGQTYSGKMVGETAMHWVQQIQGEDAMPTRKQPESGTDAMLESIRQTDAIFALEGFEPTAQTKAINAAVLAGRVTRAQVAQEMVSYIQQHQTVEGFVATRVGVIWRTHTLMTPVSSRTNSG